MKATKLLCTLALLPSVLLAQDAIPYNDTTDYWNVLTLDGGGIRGLITA